MAPQYFFDKPFRILIERTAKKSLQRTKNHNKEIEQYIE